MKTLVAQVRKHAVAILLAVNCGLVLSFTGYVTSTAPVIIAHHNYCMTRDR